MLNNWTSDEHFDPPSFLFPALNLLHRTFAWSLTNQRKKKRRNNSPLHDCHDWTLSPYLHLEKQTSSSIFIQSQWVFHQILLLDTLNNFITQLHPQLVTPSSPLPTPPPAPRRCCWAFWCDDYAPSCHHRSWQSIHPTRPKAQSRNLAWVTARSAEELDLSIGEGNKNTQKKEMKRVKVRKGISDSKKNWFQYRNSKIPFHTDLNKHLLVPWTNHQQLSLWRFTGMKFHFCEETLFWQETCWNPNVGSCSTLHLQLVTC